MIGPRLQRDREVDAPNNLAMVAVGAGLLWMGWNGFNGGDWYKPARSPPPRCSTPTSAPRSRSWSGSRWDYLTGRKPSLIGSVNGMIVGLVAITPGAGFVNGWGAIIIGVVAATIVYFALNYLSRVAPFRNVDDTLGVVYTHGFAGLAGGLLVGIFANSAMAETVLAGTISGGGLHLLGWQALTALWVIVFSAIGTFILLKLVGLFVPLRMTEEEMETGDIAVHGHEVYPSDVPSLGFPDGVAAAPAPAPRAGRRRLGRPSRTPTTTEPPPPSPGGGSVRWRAQSRPRDRAASRRTSSIVATAGVTAPPRGVAANTLRTGLAGLSARTGCPPGRSRAPAPGSGRRRRRRRPGPGRLVVVALEGDRGSKPAAWQERTTCLAQGLAAEVCTQASSRRSSS